MVFTVNILLYGFSIIVAALVFIILFFKRQYTFWKKLGVPYAEPIIPSGNVMDQTNREKSVVQCFTELYATMKARGVIHTGAYLLHFPLYVPIDLELIKHIMQVDFAHFMNHGSYINENVDPLSGHLSSLEDQKWKTLRAKLTPTFTSGKMKNMFPIIVKISEELIEVIQKQSQIDGSIEAKDISARFTTDVIGSCALGIDCNSLQDSENEFRIQGRRLLNLQPGERFSNSFSFMFPKFSKLLGLRMFPKISTDFFLKVIKYTVDYREENSVSRNDLIQLLLDLKNTKDKTNNTTITFNELAAQAFGFFFAGFEPTSTLMSFALIELAINEDIQDKLRDEINTVLKGNSDNFTYESLAEMRYLDMVIQETLRKYPPAPLVPRICTKDYKVPNTEVVIPEGTMTFIPICGIHHDPEYYPDPEKFDPTRFSDENKRTRHQFAYIPFGEGPRVCLGLRFAMMQPKIGLVSIIKNFKVKLNPRTKTPIKLDPTKISTTAQDGLWMDLERIA